MQPFVESVFVVVANLIAILLVGGLSGIIVLLAMDHATAPHLNGQEPAGNPGADLNVRRAHGSGARPTHSTVLRTSA